MPCSEAEFLPQLSFSGRLGKIKKSPIGGYCINHSTVSLLYIAGRGCFLVVFSFLKHRPSQQKASNLSLLLSPYNPRNGPLTTVWSGCATVSWSRRLVICLDTILLYGIFSYTTGPSPEWTASAIGLRFSSSFRLLSPLSFCPVPPHLASPPPS